MLRYFILDITQATLMMSHAPNKKGKEILFRDMRGVTIEHHDRHPYGDKDFQYAFVLEAVHRKFFMACATRQERDMWVNGFKVLFEYREQAQQKYNNL